MFPQVDVDDENDDDETDDDQEGDTEMYDGEEYRPGTYAMDSMGNLTLVSEGGDGYVIQTDNGDITLGKDSYISNCILSDDNGNPVRSTEIWASEKAFSTFSSLVESNGCGMGGRL